MRAARVNSPHGRVILQEVDEPEPKAEQVVVRIAASGVCHSDLHMIDGELERTKYPLTLGHEPAGYVYKIGGSVHNIKTGQKVVVYPTFGCGSCRFCLQSRENLCPKGQSLGFERDGSHAEYLLVSSPRYLLPINHLEPSESAPLSCAGVTVYSAIKHYITNNTFPDSFVAVIGVGGLGHIAVQLLSTLTQAQVIAIDIDDKKLKLAEDLGVKHVINVTAAGDEIKRIGSDNISAVMDFVGSDQTLRLGYDSLGIDGTLVVIGAAGGTLQYRGPDAKNRNVVGPIMGSLLDMKELVEMAERKKFKIVHEVFPLDEIETILQKVRHSEILGRAVVNP